MKDSVSMHTSPLPAHGCVAIPTSMIQRQFWLINQLQKDGSAYNIASVFMINGLLDIKALDESINEIVRSHEVLRTNFTTSDGEIVQNIHDQRRIELPVEDLSGVNRELREPEMMRILEHEFVQPFDLAESPLLRLRLIKLEENKNVLSMVMHHIIIDLRSKELFGAELSARYNAKTGGQPFTAPESVHQYGDYSKRQLEWLNSSFAQDMIAFWQKELQQQSGVLNLPVDYQRPASLTYNGSHADFVLDRQQSGQLEEFSRERSVNIFVTLLTVYLVLLSRHTNQQQIVIGVPLSNRRHADDKDTLGCFVNILPLAFDLSEASTFTDAMKQVRMKMLGAHRHQEAPFETIVNALKPKRDPGYNPIFQVGFTVEPYMEIELNNLAVETIKIHNKGAQLDLFLNIKSLGPEIHGYFEFNTDLFAAENIQRIRDHYLNILNAALTCADQPINLLPLLSEDEKEQLLVRFNDTDAAFADICLHQLFEEQASANPERTAVAFGQGSLTYGELNNRANQLAHALRDMGVGPETLVGVHLERSLEMLVAIYAVLKAGGAYVPLDTEFPEHRISQMLEDSRPRVILTQEKLVAGLPAADAQLVCMDRDWARIAAWPQDNLLNTASPENLAYVIFTSGSTGRPKGVQVPHRAVVNFMYSMQREPGITADDTLLAVTTLSFDISVLELFLPLTAGAKIVLADSATARDGLSLLSLLRSSGTTVIQATPTTFHLLISAGWNSFLPVKVLCGGELFPHELAQKLTGLADSVWNMYGPTETTIWSTCDRIKKDGPVLIGRPIANTRVYIVNDKNQPAPIGVAGELLIGGLGVTRGYLHRPELTGQQFIPDTFNPRSPNPVYRTGDLACWLPHGEIKILGRIDHQIKIWGFRIELGEIETAIESHPAVRQGVVKTHEYGSGDVRLTAYVTMRKGEENIQLRPYLKDLLPEYMIPSVFTVLPEMPLTLNNKIDRKALPEPDRSRPDLSGKMALPQNRMESQLAQKWAELLQLDQVGIDDTFFDLGGNSLLSIQLIAQLEKELRIQIPVVKFYQYPTIRLLSQFLQQNQKQPVSDNSGAARAKLQQQAMSKLRQRIGKRS